MMTLNSLQVRYGSVRIANYTETSFFRVKELKTHLFALPKTYCEVINYP